MVIRNFKAYRGTYEEIMNTPTEDMAFYFAWNTQQFLVGNKNGVKVPYGNCPNVVRKEVNKLLEEFRRDFSVEALKIAETHVEKSFDAVFEKAIENVNNGITILESFKDETGRNIISINGEINSLKGVTETNANSINTINSLISEIQDNIQSMDKRIEKLEVTIGSLTGAEEFEQNVSKLQNSIDAVGTKVETLEGGVGTLNSQVKEINTDLSKAIQDIEGLNTKVDGLEVSQVVERLNDLETQFINKTGELSQNISNISQSVQNLEETVNSNQSEINTINSNYSTLSNNVSNNTSDINTLKTDSDNVKASISNINNGMQGLSNSVGQNTANIRSNKADIDTLSSNISNINNQISGLKHISYKTGDEIIRDILALGSDISKFTPTFCILDSTDSNYNVGSLYYYDPDLEEITAAATGGSTGPTDVISKLIISTSYSDMEVNRDPISVSLTCSVDKMDAIDGDITFKWGGSSEVLDLSDGKTVIKTVSLPRDVIKSYTASLTASVKSETKKYRYKVENASRTFNIYQPHIFRIISSDGTSRGVARGKSIKKAYTGITTNDGDRFEILVPTNVTISAVSGPLEFPLSLSTKLIEVNGVILNYNVYESNELINDSVNITLS